MNINIFEKDLIEVCSERFAKLEELEKNLPDIIQRAIFDYKKENLRKLHEHDKKNPEAVKNRVKRYIDKNKDIINEKRREKRKENVVRLQTDTKIQNKESIIPLITHVLPMIFTLSFNS